MKPSEDYTAREKSGERRGSLLHGRPIDRHAAALPHDRFEQLHGWGMSSSGPSWIYRPTTTEQIFECYERARKSGCSLGFRGAGRSYGDASLNSEAILLDLSRMNRILDWDPRSGEITLEPGVTIGRLWQYVVEDGWWPPVVPGTMFPTIGGSVAMNVHGKNNFRVGPIGDHVTSFTIATPAGELLRCSREENRDLFLAAIGGFGMLGCFTSITLQMKRVESGFLSVQAWSVAHFGEMIELFEAQKESADYLVGWVDCFSGGEKMGRGVVHRADHRPAGADAYPARSLQASAQQLPDTILGLLPKSLIWRLMRPITNRPGIRLLNALKFRASRLLDHGIPFLQSHAAFAFLLDYVPGWKRAYGKGGLVQYQCFVPREAALRTFRAIVKRCRAHGLIPFLGVLKRHRPDDFLMTHAVDGYSLALDFKVNGSFIRRSESLAREMTDLVLKAGGRFYFAKDSLLRAEEARAFLGDEALCTFARLKSLHDPQGLLESDLARRLFGPATP